MKIGIVHFGISGPMGDTRCMGSFTKALRKAGHRVKVWTTEFNPGTLDKDWRGTKVEILPQNPTLEEILKGTSGILSKIKRKIGAVRWAEKTAKDFISHLDKDLDVLDCHNWYTYKVAPYYRKINPRARIIWTMHDPPFNYRPKKNFFMDMLARFQFWAEPFYEKRFYSRVSEIIVMDERSRDIAEKFGLPVRLLYLGIDFEHFYIPPREPAEKKITLLGVGALSPYRRFEDIVSAVAELRRRGYDAKAIIVCRDFWNDRAYRARFSEFVESSGAQEHMELLFEGVSEEGLLEIYKKSSVFVFPNHIRIWGLAALEAMAAGLPLLVSNVTSIAEVLEDGVSALFFEPLRPERIAALAEKITSEKGLYEKLAKNGQNFVKNNLSWDAYARKFLNGGDDRELAQVRHH